MKSRRFLLCLLVLAAASVALAGMPPARRGPLVPTTPADTNVTLGLIAYYPFDGGAWDMSGYGNHGTASGARLTSDMHGDSAGAYAFDGIDDYVLLPDSLIRRHASLTVTLWFRTTDGGVLFGYQSEEFPYFPPVEYVPALYVSGCGEPYGEFWNGDDTPLKGAGSVADGQWHFMALTADGAAQTLVVDGSAVGTMAGAVDHLSMIKNQIGMGNTGVGNRMGWDGGQDRWYGFRGDIDNVRIYDRALDTAECSMLFRYEPSVVSGVEEERPGVPAAFGVEQNYPNPFNPATVIAFTLPAAASVSLTVYDPLGQEVAAVLTDAPMGAGRHAVTFDADGLSSGVYFYRLRAVREGAPAISSGTRRMLLLR